MNVICEAIYLQTQIDIIVQIGVRLFEIKIPIMTIDQIRVTTIFREKRH